MAEVLTLDNKAMSNTFFSPADEFNNNTISISECKDNSQGINDDRKILTINLDSVSKCLKGRNVNVELHHNYIIPKEEIHFEQSSWSQTQDDMKKLRPENNCDKTIQITNVISLASEMSDQFIKDIDSKIELESLMHNERKESQVPTFNEKSCCYIRSSLDEMGNINEETNSSFNDIYITEKEQSAHTEKYRSFFPDSSFDMQASKEQQGNCCNLQFCPTNLDHLYKEPHFKPDGEQCCQYETDQYKNIEFSAIFSSLEDYNCYQEDSFDESIITPQESQNWGKNYTESQNNLIIDLDNQKEMQDGGTCDDNSILKSEKIICRDIHKDCEKETYTIDNEEILEKNKSAKIDSGDIEWQNYFYSNLSEATEPSLHYIGFKKWQHAQHSPQFLKLPSYGAASAMNSNSTPYSGNIFDKSLQDMFPYDQYINDCYGQYPLEQFYYHPKPDNQPISFSDWNQLAAMGNNISDIYDISKVSVPSSEPSTWATLSPSLRNDSSSEIMSFSQTDITDDEETDDADEIDNLSVTFSLSNSDNKSIIPLSPRSLTSSPLSTSTPISSISQESQAPEDLSTCPYPVALTCVNNPNIQGKNLIMPQCKLDSSLFSFGTEHGVKLPYPSMADVMRRNRLAARSIYVKKLDNENSQSTPRRCGRPRKNQIQSAKITTSTSKITKAKVKTSLKLKGCCPEISQAEADNSNDYDEAGSSSSNSRNSRHNEPLNQKAVYIMSKWYTENINNPYPSKTDKEEMARQGGITENQVKSWFANKRNRTNNTKPKVQKRVMEQKLQELFKDLKHNSGNPSADNTHIIQQLSGILQQCHAKQAE